MRDIFIIGLIHLICVGSLISQKLDPYARDLVQIIEFYTGVFDNDSQIWFENRRGYPGTEEDKHQRLHAIHTRIHIPSIGDNVFYVEEYIDNDPENIIRQRIVNFKSDIEAGGIVMQVYFLKNPKELRHAYLDIAKLEALSLDDMFGLDGCDVIFKREGDQFFGQMGSKTCQFGKEDKKRYSVHNIHLSASKYWRTDQTYLVATDQIYSGHKNSEPHKMRKANFYNCDISFTEKGYYDPSGNDKKYSDLNVHTQGGSVTVHNPIQDKMYTLQLREKEYPYYATGSDFFMMRFIEKDAKRSEVIITAEPGVEKISFSLGWSSAACYKQ